VAETYNTKITNSGIQSASFVFNASSGVALGAKDLDNTGIVLKVDITSRPYELPTIHGTQITNNGINSAVFQFTVKEFGPQLLGAVNIATSGVVESAEVASATELATPGLTNSPLTQYGAVDISHNIFPYSILLAPNNIQECLASTEHNLSKWNLTATNLIQEGEADTDQALRAVGVDAVHRVQKDAIAVTHATQTTGLLGGNAIEKGGVLVTFAMSAKDISPTNTIEMGTVISHAEMGALNLGYSGAVLPIIQAGRIEHEGEVSGPWEALPIATILFSDVYDENDVLAGVDAHDSVADQTDTRWLRPDYTAGETTAVFTFRAGALEVSDPASIDTVNLVVYGASMGVTDDDPMTFDCQIIAVDNVTELTPRVTSFTQTDVSESFARFDTTLPINIAAYDSWVDARIYFRWTHGKNFGLDSAALAVSQLYLTGMYTSHSVNNNLTQMNPIPYARAQVTQVGTSVDIEQAENTISGGFVQQIKTVESDNLAQEVGVANPIQSASADIEHALHIPVTYWTVYNYLERGRVWHDLFLEGHSGLASYGKIQGDNVIEIQDLFTTNLDQDYNRLSSALVEGEQQLSATSLDQSIGVEIESAMVESHPLLLPNIAPPINYIQQRRIGYSHPCTVGQVANIPLIGETRIIMVGRINAAIPSSVGEIKSGFAWTEHRPATTGCEAAGVIEDPLMLKHHALTGTGVEQPNLVEPAAMLLPYELTTPGIDLVSTVEPAAMLLPYEIVARAMLQLNFIARGETKIPDVMETTGLTQDNEILKRAVDVPIIAGYLNAEHEIEDNGIVVTHILGAGDAANDPACGPALVRATHELAALSVQGVTIIKPVNFDHVNGILGSENLAPTNLIQSTLHELIRDRYATAMVIGV
jgi:hypothetical protein